MHKYLRYFFISVFTVLSMNAQAQNQVSGVLYASGGSGGFDWNRPSQFVKSIPSTGSIKLQSRFIWGSPATISDHAIVAFVQGSNGSWINAAQNNYLWTHGAGAHVSSLGLSLEFWFNSNGGAQGSAYVWSSTDICGIGVGPEAVVNPGLCLSTSNTAPAYITQVPSNWSLVAGREYWVRIAISPDGNSGWHLLTADLIDPTFPGWVVQTARFGFMKSNVFPLATTVDGVLARAPGSNVNIDYVAFDGGF
ncbi:hypothetical protein [Ottowia oryzae]